MTLLHRRNLRSRVGLNAKRPSAFDFGDATLERSSRVDQADYVGARPGVLNWLGVYGRDVVRIHNATMTSGCHRQRAFSVLGTGHVDW